MRFVSFPAALGLLIYRVERLRRLGINVRSLVSPFRSPPVETKSDIDYNSGVTLDDEQTERDITPDDDDDDVDDDSVNITNAAIGSNEVNHDIRDFTKHGKHLSPLKDEIPTESKTTTSDSPTEELKSHEIESVTEENRSSEMSQSPNKSTMKPTEIQEGIVEEIVSKIECSKAELERKPTDGESTITTHCSNETDDKTTADDKPTSSVVVNISDQQEVTKINIGLKDGTKDSPSPEDCPENTDDKREDYTISIKADETDATETTELMVREDESVGLTPQNTVDNEDDLSKGMVEDTTGKTITSGSTQHLTDALEKADARDRSPVGNEEKVMPPEQKETDRSSVKEEKNISSPDKEEKEKDKSREEIEKDMSPEQKEEIDRSPEEKEKTMSLREREEKEKDMSPEDKVKDRSPDDKEKDCSPGEIEKDCSPGEIEKDCSPGEIEKDMPSEQTEGKEKLPEEKVKDMSPDDKEKDKSPEENEKNKSAEEKEIDYSPESPKEIDCSPGEIEKDMPSEEKDRKEKDKSSDDKEKDKPPEENEKDKSPGEREEKEKDRSPVEKEKGSSPGERKNGMSSEEKEGKDKSPEEREKDMLPGEREEKEKDRSPDDKDKDKSPGEEKLTGESEEKENAIIQGDKAIERSPEEKEGEKDKALEEKVKEKSPEEKEGEKDKPLEEKVKEKLPEEKEPEQINLDTIEKGGLTVHDVGNVQTDSNETLDSKLISPINDVPTADGNIKKSSSSDSQAVDLDHPKTTPKGSNEELKQSLSPTFDGTIKIADSPVNNADKKESDEDMLTSQSVNESISASDNSTNEENKSLQLETVENGDEPNDEVKPNIIHSTISNDLIEQKEKTPEKEHITEETGLKPESESEKRLETEPESGKEEKQSEHKQEKHTIENMSDTNGHIVEQKVTVNGDSNGFHEDDGNIITEEDSHSSMKMMRGEVSAKTTYQKTSTGPVSIAEVNPEGKFITLENTSSQGREVNLDGWKLKRELDGQREIVYTFRNFTLKPRKSVKIFARGSEREAGINDLVFRDSLEETWGIGSQVSTTLVNEKGEEKATHRQRTAYN